MKPSAEDVTKLPKWAQRRIEVLERNLEQAQAKLDEDPEDSNTFADPLSGWNGDIRGRRCGRPLGTDTRIRYWYGSRFDEYFDVRYDSDREQLEVRTNQTLHVLPSASNSIYVEAHDR